jgi:iron complex transport system substrate-binding protein
MLSLPKLFALLIAAILIVTACSNSARLDPTLQPLKPLAADCRFVHHAMGTTCVPEQPQRVVVWGGTELDPVLALNVKPIAGTPNILNYVREKLPASQWQGIEDIDSPGGPNLERLLLLKPDLILGHVSRVGAALYHQLAQIAPTVLDDADDWKQSFRLFAAALNKTDAAEQVLEAYHARIAEFKARMDNRLPMTASILEIRPDVLIVYTKDIFPMQILIEAGLSLPPVLEKYDWRSWLLSQERLDEVDADAIFVLSWGGSQRNNRMAQSALNKLKSQPLWFQLNAVQQNKIYQVGDYIQGIGPLTANLILDDLYKYLISTKS